MICITWTTHTSDLRGEARPIKILKTEQENKTLLYFSDIGDKTAMK